MTMSDIYDINAQSDFTIKHVKRESNYINYHIGPKNADGEKDQEGSERWINSECNQSYEGEYLHDCMHGVGEYKWRYASQAAQDVVYEGRFYANEMEGYGRMSYASGEVFHGLFRCNRRFGPGVSSWPDLSADVGLWQGRRLLRLCWLPPAALRLVPTVLSERSIGAPDYIAAVIANRTLVPVPKDAKPSEQEKKYFLDAGADEDEANAMCGQLLTTKCNDKHSLFFKRQLFDSSFFGNEPETLVITMPAILSPVKPENEHSEARMTSRISHRKSKGGPASVQGRAPVTHLIAWNNSETVTNMMQHSFKNRIHESMFPYNLQDIICGDRASFRKAGPHERDCVEMLLSAALGEHVNVARLKTSKNLHPDVSDGRGNSALMYATAQDSHEAMTMMLNLGADVDHMNDEGLTPLSVCLLRYLAVYWAVRDWGISFVIPTDNNAMDNLILQRYSEDILATEWCRNVEAKEPFAKSFLLSSCLQEATSRRGAGCSVRQTMQLPLQVPGASKPHKDLGSGTKTILEPRDDTRNESCVAMTGTQATYSRRLSTSKCDTSIGLKPLIDSFNNYADETQIFGDSTNMKCLFVLNPIPLGRDRDTDATKRTSKIKASSAQMSDKTKESALDGKGVEIIERLALIKLSISHLLHRGADPCVPQYPVPAMAMAALTKSATIIRELVAAGADPNKIAPMMKNYPPLHIMLTLTPDEDLLESMKALLECKADPNGRIAFVNIPNVFWKLFRIDESSGDGVSRESGPTPLHVIALMYESDDEDQRRALAYLEMLKLLLSFGANPELLCAGFTILSLAISKKDLTFTKYLLEVIGVDPNTSLGNRVGNTLAMVLSYQFISSMSNFEAEQSHSKVAVSKSNQAKSVARIKSAPAKLKSEIIAAPPEATLPVPIDYLEVLFKHGADPLSLIHLNDGFSGNITQFILKEIQALEDTLVQHDDPNSSIEIQRTRSAGPVVKSDKEKKKSPKGAKGKKEKAKSKDEILIKKKGKDKEGPDKEYRKRFNVSRAIKNYREYHIQIAASARVRCNRRIRGKSFLRIWESVARKKHAMWYNTAKDNKLKSETQWLTVDTGLTTWYALTSSGVKITDATILQKVLCIILYCNTYMKYDKLRYVEFSEIETAVLSKINMYKELQKVQPLFPANIVQPEAHTDDAIYNVCYDCTLPINVEKALKCEKCGLIQFCSEDCQKMDAFGSTSLHPCELFSHFPSACTSATSEGSTSKGNKHPKKGKPPKKSTNVCPSE